MNLWVNTEMKLRKLTFRELSLLLVFLVIIAGALYFVSSRTVRVKKINLYDYSGVVKEEYNNAFYEMLSESDIVYFLGDSITCGSANEGHPWYEPITKVMDVDSRCFAFPGWTTYSMIEGLTVDPPFGDISEERDKNVLFVIALGTNDILHNNPDYCAMDAEEYIQQISAITSIIKAQYPDANFVFIAPWHIYLESNQTFDGYDVAQPKYVDYSASLAEYCEQNEYVFIEPHNYIDSVLRTVSNKDYLSDALHPNAEEGIHLYSEAVLRYE